MRLNAHDVRTELVLQRAKRRAADEAAILGRLERLLTERRGAAGGEAEPHGARSARAASAGAIDVRCRSVRSCPVGPTKGVWV